MNYNLEIHMRFLSLLRYLLHDFCVVFLLSLNNEQNLIRTSECHAKVLRKQHEKPVLPHLSPPLHVKFAECSDYRRTLKPPYKWARPQPKRTTMSCCF